MEKRNLKENHTFL